MEIRKARQSCRAFALSPHQILSHINGAGNQNDKTLDDILHIGIDAEEGKTDENQTQQHHAKDNAADFARAAHKGYAADDAGGDGVQLIVQTR